MPRLLKPSSRPAEGQGHTGTIGAALLLGGVILLAASLRPAIAMVGPVLAAIRTDLGLNGTETSILMALPVMFFGLCAPIAPTLSRRLGARGAVLVALGALLTGSVLRLAPTWPALVAGTCLLSAGIAVGNVLLPVFAKTHFPTKIGLVTGISTMSLNLAAACSAATVVPLAVLAGGNWRGGMLVWLLPIVAALVCWMFIRGPRQGASSVEPLAVGRGFLRRNPAARPVIAFTASQSVIYYCMLAWLPSIYQSHGLSAADSGVLLSIATVIGAPVGLIVPTIASRMRDQRALLVVIVACAGAGLAGLLAAPSVAPALWAVLLGIGQGGAFPLALVFFALKTSDGAQTAQLSMLAQTVAYVLAALGPFTLGLLHESSGTWTGGLLLLAACLAVEAVAGLRAARPTPRQLDLSPILERTDS